MIPLGPDEIRASRRPWLLLLLWLARLGLGLCLAYPLAALVGTSGVGMRPEGDAALFADGGYLLLELLRLRGAELSALLRGLMPLLLVGLGFTVLSNAALLVALNYRGRLPAREWLGATLRPLPAFLLLSLVLTLAQGLVLLLGSSLAAAIPESLTSPRAHDFELALVLLLTALAAGALGSLGDVVKAHLIRHQLALGQSFTAALGCLKQRPLTTCLGWLPYALCALLGLAGAAWLTGTIDVARPGAARIAAVFLTHQLVILLLIALRAAWFARTLRLAATSGPRFGSTS